MLTVNSQSALIYVCLPYVLCRENLKGPTQNSAFCCVVIISKLKHRVHYSVLCLSVLFIHILGRWYICSLEHSCFNFCTCLALNTSWTVSKRLDELVTFCWVRMENALNFINTTFRIICRLGSAQFRGGRGWMNVCVLLSLYCV